MQWRTVFVLAASVFVSATALGDDVIVGSGKPVSKDVKVADFTSVEVNSAFQVTITRGDKFGVTITADDNLIEHVKAIKEGSALKISMTRSWQGGPNSVMKATITMPALEALNLSGATTAAIDGFKSQKSFKLTAAGASRLQGEIIAGKVDLEITGASRVTLKGSAEEAALSATGASGMELSELAVGSARVSLSGASTAKVNAKSKLDYSIDGASRFEYQGDPTIGKARATDASSVSRKQ